MVKINKKIVGYSIVDKDTPPADLVHMNELLARPEVLPGTTYKVKTPLSDAALYITINDTILNAGTAHEVRRPFEIFINSKEMANFQWIVGMTRMISAIFRKGGELAFLVDELKSVHDPKGGYFKPGGKYMPSLVAEIGSIIETHLQNIGIIEPVALDAGQEALVEEVRQEAAAKTSGAMLCAKCGEVAVVILDGCATCSSCGDSKCG